ncbi:unnamed protein product [Penicillium olsonii]|nr:unnamed protein product [Penicillium olsonii]CAG7932600.1 unnamed protein product [Penicillium olsonii]
MPLPQSIQALPSDVIAKLKSSTAILDLSGVILELVKNALDGGAHTIFVTVDFQRGGCIVEDDGNGIPPNEFETTGGLGKPHHTSRFEQNDSYGHRGLFLASLASLSLLTLTSHHAAHESTNSIIFHHSKPVARLIPAPSHHTLRSASHGTSVTVNDLFGNMPVRVKNRAITLRKAGEADREWDNLRNSLISLVLANPQALRLVLLDTEKSKRMSIRPSALISPTAQAPSGDAFEFRRIGSVLTQCGLISPRNWECWHELSASVPDLTVRAAISLQACPSRKTQFISLGKEPLMSRNGSNILYNEINRLFSLSDFGNFDTRPNHASPRAITHPVGTSEAQSIGSARSWTKPINRWPMFYIRIDTSDAPRLGKNDESEHLPESDKSLQRIVDVLGAMVREFLKQHNMRPRSGKQRTQSSDRGRSILTKGSCSIQSAGVDPNQDRLASSADEAFSGHFKIPSFARSQGINYSQDFTNWSRVKAAKAPESYPIIPRSRTPITSPGINQFQSERALPTRNQRGSGGLNQHREPQLSFGRSNNPSVGGDQNIVRTQSEQTSSPPSPNKMLTWIDPHTKLAYLINPRTGQTLNSRKSLATKSHHLPISHGEHQDPAHGLWFQNLLETWENPSFSRTEVPIPNLGAEAVPSNDMTASHDCFKGIGSLTTAQVAKYRGKLLRRDLETAEVIAQVDKKFILAKVPSTALRNCESETSNDFLLLIDQHAADERCRIEQLFEEMFLPPGEAVAQDTGVRTVQVFLEFQVSETEGRLFNRYKTDFTSWGVHYDTEVKNSSTSITFHTLPVLIAERCRTEPQVLIDLMRREIWSSEEVGGKSFQPKRDLGSEIEDQPFTPLGIEDPADKNPPFTSHSWVRKMNGCPQGIIDLLNSRACRTAIMFNDPLDIGECRALLSRLARCAFPFQCAHGRPSMVPILDLRSVPDTTTSFPSSLKESESADDRMELDYMDAFRASYST